MPTKCFLIHPIAKRAQWLRRFTFSSDGNTCAGSKWGHDADARVEDRQAPIPGPGEYEAESRWQDFVTKDDPRWPLKCERCDYHFRDGDQWQLFSLRVYCDVAGQEHLTHPRYATPGSMWWSDWLHHGGGCMYWDNCGDRRGHLNVILPGGHQWDVMSRASNCTMKADRQHRCWVLHENNGVFTVDKNGLTCAAGAGSIMAGNYHGFLRNGELT